MIILKQGIIICIVVIIAIAIVYCSSKKVQAIEPQRNNIRNAVSPVSIILHNVSPNGISFHFENKTDNRYTYGEDYVLYVREGNDWRIVDPIIEKWGFNAIGYTLEPQSITDTITINWQWLFGQLPPGEYQIQKTILFIREPGDYDRFIVDQYFKIAHD